jgi:16S rRNA (uracil1498-N3)-methyltransferase
MPPAPRCYCPDLARLHDAVSESERHHLLHVLRLKEGDPLLLFDGAGHTQAAHIMRLDKKNFILAPAAPPQTYLRPAPSIIAALAIPKHDAWQEQLTLSVPLGISILQPLITARTETRLSAKQIQEKMGKWRRVLIESAKQSASAHIPELRPPIPFETYLQTSSPNTLSFVASLEETSKPIREILDPLTAPPASISILIGPEGDFTPQEYASSYQHGYKAISLGSLILRCPLALAVIISQIRYRFPA